jgi:hypothetical protein
MCNNRARQALAAHIQHGPVAAVLAAYQDHLIEQGWLAVQADTARKLEEVASPHEDDPEQPE